MHLPVFAQPDHIVASAEHCIVLFMNGGPSQLDTFDPKPGTANGGPFKAIQTSVKGVEVAETLPQVAEQAHHLSICLLYTSELPTNREV